LRRSPAFREALPSAAQIAEENEMRSFEAIPKMTDGDLGISKSWVHEPSPETIILRGTRWRIIPAKPSPARWLADLANVLCWGAALVALAIVLVAVFDVWKVLGEKPEPSAMTFYLSL
jgi:hypothetical protein